MRRIDTDNGLFAAGNPALGIKGTIVPHWWPNTLQEEVANVVESFGLDLDSEDDAQLLQAMKIMAGRRFWVDPAVTDHSLATAEGNRSIADHYAVIGANECATLYFPHIGAADKTYFPIDSSIDISAKPRIRLLFEHGAELSRTTGNEIITMDKPEQIGAGPRQQVVSADMLRFARRGVIRPEWYGATDGVDCYAATQYAANAIQASGGIILMDGDTYLYALQSGPINPSVALYDNTTVKMGDNTRLLSQGSACGVNGYSGGTSALFLNEDMVGGNKNIALIGGIFKSAGDNGAGGHYAGGAFFAFRKITRLRLINLTIMDVNGSCRGQISHCVDVVVDGYRTDYKENWFTAGPFSFEDGIRFGSGCRDVILNNYDIHSGDDAIAINNEPCENPNNSTVGADIYNITIGPGIVRTRAGHALRIYQEATMTAGHIGTIRVTGLIGAYLNGGDGLSIANYATGPTIDDVVISNYRGIQITSTAAGVLVLNASRVRFVEPHLSGWFTGGINANNAINLRCVNPTVYLPAAGGSGSGILIANGSDGAQISGGEIVGPPAHGIAIDGSDNVIVQGTNINTPGNNGVLISNAALNTTLVANRIGGVSAPYYAINEASGNRTNAALNNLIENANTILLTGAQSVSSNNIIV
ncbi:MAG: right-handed parallel beta-helix repeat-containing protein [Desulfobacteraceae bacterium]|nr:right-handed parallel beta-helix repeat-containing protein [Desulfobacteraceae bacterium]